MLCPKCESGDLSWEFNAGHVALAAETAHNAAQLYSDIKDSQSDATEATVPVATPESDSVEAAATDIQLPPHQIAIEKRNNHLREAFHLLRKILVAWLKMPMACRQCNHSFIVLDTNSVKAILVFAGAGFLLAGTLSDSDEFSSLLLILLEMVMLLVIASKNKTNLHLLELGCSTWLFVWIAQLLKGFVLSDILDITDSFFVDGFTAGFFMVFFGLLFDSYITVTRYRMGMVFSPAGNSSCLKVILVTSSIILITMIALILGFGILFGEFD